MGDGILIEQDSGHPSVMCCHADSWNHRDGFLHTEYNVRAVFSYRQSSNAEDLLFSKSSSVDYVILPDAIFKTLHSRLSTHKWAHHDRLGMPDSLGSRVLLRSIRATGSRTQVLSSSLERAGGPRSVS